MMLLTFNTLVILLAFSLNLSAQTIITNADRLSWSQIASSLIVAQSYSYIVYIDDTIRRSLENVICSGAMSPFSCNSKFPPFASAGIHNLQLTTADVAESVKSNVFQIQIVAPEAPSNLGIVSNGITHTVKLSGGDFATILDCATIALAGDICEIYAGSYSGWIQPRSGINNNFISFVAHPGDNVSIVSNIIISNHSYIKLSSLSFNGAGIIGNGISAHNIINQNTFINKTRAIYIPDGLGSGASDNILSNNIININSIVSSEGSLYLYGDRNRIENNEIYGGGGDCMILGGSNVVVRNNYCHDMDASISKEHIDFIQVMGAGTNPTLQYSLIENNRFRNCVDSTGNCHALLIRTCSGVANCSLVANTIIFRFNYIQNINGSGPGFGGPGDNVPNAHIYNNTIATESPLPANGECSSFQNAADGVAINNICYNTTTGGWAPFYWFTSASGDYSNGNLVFTSNYNGSWPIPYSLESTYIALRNKNPLFVNYPINSDINSSSPAYRAGVNITTVANTDVGFGKSLVLVDSKFFQSGWALIQSDWIRIGPSTISKIESIDYFTNTITLSSSVNRMPGDEVNLYTDSSGTIKLHGVNLDVGSYQVEN